MSVWHQKYLYLMRACARNTLAVAKLLNNKIH